jgi:hypothetical protein
MSAAMPRSRKPRNLIIAVAAILADQRGCQHVSELFDHIERVQAESAF